MGVSFGFAEAKKQTAREFFAGRLGMRRGVSNYA
jgi:hypothetical protein